MCPVTQNGDLMSGVACGGFIGFPPVKDMAVTGSYPNVRFTDSLGRVFSGKFEAHRDQIAGNLGSLQLRFNRIDRDGRCSWPVVTMTSPAVP